MIEGIIYCATSPSNKKYYGFSLNFDNRKQTHYRNAYAGKTTLFYTAIRKYGFDNFMWKIIEKHFAENNHQLKKILGEREKYWIKEDKTYLKEHGYNMTLGGEGGSPTLEVINKIRKTLTGRKRSTEFKEKNRQSHLGTNSGENCNFISYIEKNRKGKTLKSEMIKIYGKDEGIKRYKWIEKTALAHSKPIIQLDINDNIINEWPSINAASNAGFLGTNICACLKGKRNTHKKFKWRYKNGD